MGTQTTKDAVDDAVGDAVGHAAARFETSGPVATITLNRPEQLNALNDDLVHAMVDGIRRVAEDPNIRVLVLTGEGRGFCSGADLSGLGGERAGASLQAKGGSTGAAATRNMDEVLHPAILALAEAPVPTIARVNGVVAGGGLGLALGCDITVAARSARFVCTFGPRLGIVPDLGTTFHLTNRLGPARARGIAMLGDPISADQAAEWGLIWSVVDDDALDDEIAALTDRFARSSPGAMTRIREAILDARTNSLDAQLDVERDHQGILIDRNMVEGATAFMNKREPVFDNIRG